MSISFGKNKPNPLSSDFILRVARSGRRAQNDALGLLTKVPLTCSPPESHGSPLVGEVYGRDAKAFLKQPSPKVLPAVIDLDEPGYLRLPQVLKLLGISRSGFYKGIQDGIYPRQVKLSPNPNSRAVGWPKAALKQLLSDLEA